MEKLIDWKTLEEKPYVPVAQVARRAAADGCVLLKNEGNILPLGKENVISLFGRTQIDYYKSGTGSGGLVRVDYVVNILDGIMANNSLTLNTELVDIYKKWIEKNPFDAGEGWAKEPWSQKEMVPDEETVAAARAKSDTAVIVFGRTAGEDCDNSEDKGSWLLTDDEEKLLDLVSRHFDRTVVLLNVGNIIDMSWVEKYNIKSVMYVWQGGQEGGNAIADVLSGKVTPSGHLTDTIAKDIKMYPGIKNFGNPDRNLYQEDIYVGYRYFETFAPDDVLYPFGFGLSYTEFDKNFGFVGERNGKIAIEVTVKNVGAYSGREVVQVYFEAPQGRLGKSARELCAFAKTALLAPNDSETLTVEFDIDKMSAYDDSGIAGYKSAYVMEAGEYNIYVGGCVRCARKVYTYTVGETRVTQQLTEALAPTADFEIMYPVRDGIGYKTAYKKVSQRTVDYDKRIFDERPQEIEQTGDKGIKLIDVKNGKNTIREFVAQLTDDDLICIVKGEGMCSPKVRAGSAGAIGGVTESLAKLGIPLIAVHDGPSGIRMDSGEKATSLPNGTALACTWDTQLAEELYRNVSVELCTHKIDSLLGPGINIHRVPLCGRNFEYFSEDPFITGKMAAALIRGMAAYGNSATVKHFMANSQEYSRARVDAVMSERAAREIYLKGFEYAVKEGHATSLMTSYNPINGIWAANNYDLNTTILRGEWGYEGFVMTDWWPTLAPVKTDTINLKNLVEAQNDVYMLTADVLTCRYNIRESLENGSITRGQLQRNAINILKYVANSHALERFVEFGGRLTKSLADRLDELETVAVFENPANGAEFELDLKGVGERLFAVEYSSVEPELTQMIVNILINNINAASITVNGNGGKTSVVYRDAAVAFEDVKLKLAYPEDILKITKLTILK